jgi:hypothetical protein
VARADDELPATVIPDRIFEVARVLFERRGFAAGIYENPSVSLHDAFVARVCRTVRAADADPTPVEEMLLLPP